LVANDDVVLLSEQIDELSLGFVSPLQSNHTSRGHSIPQGKSLSSKETEAGTISRPKNPSKLAIKDADLRRVKRARHQVVMRSA
jgi:hypothetical protein